MRTTDSRGQRFPNIIQSKGKKLREPSKPRIALLETLQWFGPLPSSHAKAILHVSGMVNEKTKKQTLVDLASEDYNGGKLLVRPKWQYPDRGVAWPSRHHHLIHDIGPAGIKFLEDTARFVPRTNDAHFYHWLMKSCALAELYVGAQSNRDYTFIPSHRATKSPLEFTVHLGDMKTTLRPDAHFAIDYGGQQRHFFLETDRGTEQKTKVLHGKKTLERSLRQYREFIASRNGKDPQYHKALDTRAPLLVLFLFNNEEVMKTALDIMETITEGKGNNYMLFRYDPRFTGKQYQAPMLSLDNWHGAWKRYKRPDMHIDK